uniref:Retrotransposon Copia-like N-terminal domain-containing protein n=1 Tax=Solanum lycopersicum TaxID=4081 RepID=A0A3Q7H8D6_SOLLC
MDEYMVLNEYAWVYELEFKNERLVAELLRLSSGPGQGQPTGSTSEMVLELDQSKCPNTSNKSNNMNSLNPYFLQHSDKPSLMLVPIKFNGINYPTWSKSMIHALTAKKKLSFIDGSIEPPPSKIDKPTEYGLCSQCNRMILSCLDHSVESDLSRGVIYAKMAHQVRQDLKDQFIKRMHQQYIRFKNH